MVFLLPLAELTLTFRGRELDRVPITAVTTTIGRDINADLTIDNVGVSRVHAQIVFNGMSFVVSDAGSQNGITVNGEPVSMMALAEGDAIGINKFLVHFSEVGGMPRENLQQRMTSPSMVPRDVLRTMNLDPASAAAITEATKQEIKQRQATRSTPSPTTRPGAAGHHGTGHPGAGHPGAGTAEPTRSSSTTLVFLSGLLVAALLLLTAFVLKP